MMTLDEFRQKTDMFPGDSLLVIDTSKGHPTLVIAKPLGRCYDIEVRGTIPQDEIDDLVDVFTTPPSRRY